MVIFILVQFLEHLSVVNIISDSVNLSVVSVDPPQSVAFTYNWEDFFISYIVLSFFCPRPSLTSWLWNTHRYPLSVHMFIKQWCAGVNAPWDESWSEKPRNDRQLKWNLLQCGLEDPINTERSDISLSSLLFIVSLYFMSASWAPVPHLNTHIHLYFSSA